MSNAPAAISASFADFKLVKTRKTAQFVFEVPLEHADAALTALGGLPSAAEERWCGIARLDLKAAQAPATKDRRPFSSLPYAQQAALMCNDERFRDFMRCGSADECASAIRRECGVASRAEIEADEGARQRWLNILRDFERYKQGYR